MSPTMEAAQRTLKWAMQGAFGNEGEALAEAQEWINEKDAFEAARRQWFFAAAAPMMAMSVVRQQAKADGVSISDPGDVHKYVTVHSFGTDADTDLRVLLQVMSALATEDADMAHDLILTHGKQGGSEALFRLAWTAVAVIAVYAQRNPGLLGLGVQA